MKSRSKKLWMVSVIACLYVVFLWSISEGAEVFFEDNFDGTALDASKWNTDIATSGMRFCPTDGTWKDASSEPCYGNIQSIPYGFITVANGEASFSSDYRRTFPFIWAGPPSRPSPFPSVGDFILEIRMKYDSIRVHGDGLDVFYSQNTDSVDDNPPSPSGQGMYAIWADAGGFYGGGIGISPYSAEAYTYHDYRLEYIDGYYSMYRDGVLTAGPIADNRWPNTIWIGNPLFAVWGANDWTDFTIDYIRVTVLNNPPVANAGPDRTVEMTSCVGASVTLNGAGSSDPDGDALTYIWTENGNVIATGVNPTITLSYGTHTITLTVDDGKGDTGSDDVVINVVDTTPPVLSVTMSTNLLWPPNHKYVTVTPSITVTDACQENVTVLMLSASSNEPDNGLGDGDTANDIVVNSDGTILLRAERSGKGTGRVYTITYQATDAAGNSATAMASVTVPHDK